MGRAELAEGLAWHGAGEGTWRPPPSWGSLSGRRLDLQVSDDGCQGAREPASLCQVAVGVEEQWAPRR